MADESDRLPDIPGYEILERIGKGAMGTVYRGIQTRLQRPVAIKLLPPVFAASPGYVARFIREARAAARLNHPNVVAGIDAGEHAGVHYFVMEYVRGVPYKQMIRDSGGGIPETEVLRVALQIARALDHAHRNQILHRDVKPENILITDDGTAKLCDFGLARDAGAAPGGRTHAIGTPNYMSPEQARGQPDVDVRADLYSLGCTMYHALTGDVPFRGDSGETVMARHLADAPVPPKSIRPWISEEVNGLVLDLLEKDRHRRPASPAVVVERIEALLSNSGGGHTTRIRRPTASGRRATASARRITASTRRGRVASTGRSTAALKAARAPRRRPGPAAALGLALAALIAGLAIAFLLRHWANR